MVEPFDNKVVIPTLEDAFFAAENLKPFFVETPLIEAPAFSDEIGVRVFAKVDALLPSGSFKYRGALNFLLQLSDEEKEKGVVAYSTGNHAQAVALAARNLGLRAKIVMPSNAPQVKINNTRSYGGDVHLFDLQTESREEIAREYASRGMALLPPYDHPRVVAGQATSGLEIFAQLARLGLQADSVLACASGGGLLAGISLAAQGVAPETNVYAVGTEAMPVWSASFAAKKRVGLPFKDTICDALAPAKPIPGHVPWEVVKSHLAGVYDIGDDSVRNAMAQAQRKFGISLEPGGAIALAAVLEHRKDFEGQTVVVTLSGRNRDY